MTIASFHKPTRLRATPFAAVVLAGGIAALAGCASQSKISGVETTGSVPDDYRVNHPIAVEEGVASIDIPVGVYSGPLNDAMKSNVTGFAQRFKESGSSLIAVVAPSGSPNQTIAANTAVEIQAVLRGMGIPAGEIDYRVYHAASDERNAPIRVAYSRITAETAPCGPWSDQLSSNKENKEYFAFGCATQQNLAAVVDNPLDLLYPRGLTPPDAARRSAALDNYEQGKVFSSDQSKNIGGSVFTEVGQ